MQEAITKKTMFLPNEKSEVFIKNYIIGENCTNKALYLTLQLHYYLPSREITAKQYQNPIYILLVKYKKILFHY